MALENVCGHRENTSLHHSAEGTVVFPQRSFWSIIYVKGTVLDRSALQCVNRNGLFVILKNHFIYF